MRIVLTGGGTGGHFYPLIATAEQIRKLAQERKLIDPELFYIGPEPFDREALLELSIEWRKSPAGKMRRYFSFLNFLDFFKTAWGIAKATRQLFVLYPDVVFSKGGYASFPTVFAARLLRIPVIIHESDAVPGRANLAAAKWAQAIGIAHPDAIDAFPRAVRDRIALIGLPIRYEIEKPSPEGGHEFLKLDSTAPTIFVTGGSLGSEAINNVILDALPVLVERYNIVHQAGRDHLDEVKGIAAARLHDTRYDNRYRAFGLLNTLAIRMAAGIASLVIARAGSGTIFEIASWGKPSILVPIPEDVSHDQTRNAFSYARTGAAVVIEQANLTPHLLAAEIDRVMQDPTVQAKMAVEARKFAQPEAAKKMAEIILKTALRHTN